MEPSATPPMQEQTNVRLPTELKEWIKRRAVQERRSFNAEMVLVLEAGRRTVAPPAQSAAIG